jgi:hypothetical protein
MGQPLNRGQDQIRNVAQFSPQARNLFFNGIEPLF